MPEYTVTPTEWCYVSEKTSVGGTSCFFWGRRESVALVGSNLSLWSTGRSKCQKDVRKKKSD